MIGDVVVEVLSQFGMLGLIGALFAIFLIDSMIFPALPDFFLLAIYATNPQEVWWGILLFVVAVTASFVGNSLLYTIVKRLSPPKWIQRAMRKYAEVLIFADERMLLVNRIAPILPYTGAFIAVNNWDYKKAMLYVVVGAMAKFGILILLSQTFYALFDAGFAQRATFVLIIITLLISLLASIYQRRRLAKKERLPRNES